MTKHTPEPWKTTPTKHPIANTFGVSADGVWIAKCHPFDGDHNGVDAAKSNARRIVAAVNACAGIPTEALESGVVGEIITELRHSIRCTCEGCAEYETDFSCPFIKSTACESYKRKVAVLSKLEGSDDA